MGEMLSQIYLGDIAVEVVQKDIKHIDASKSAQAVRAGVTVSADCLDACRELSHHVRCHYHKMFTTHPQIEERVKLLRAM